MKISKNFVLASVLTFLILNIYIEIPFSLGNGKVLPAYPYIFSMPVVLLIVKSNLRHSDILFLIQVEILILASILLSIGIEYWQEKLIGSLQMSISIIAGLFLFRLILLIRHQTLETILLSLWLSFAVGSLLEISGVLDQASDSFRHWAYSSGNYSAYDDVNRDFDLAGRVRPKLFSSEPSMLAIGFMVFINGWLALRISASRLIKVLIANVVVYGIVGSPIIILSLTLSIANYLFLLRKRRLFNWIFIGALSLGLLTSIATQSETLGKRVFSGNLGLEVGTNSSENIRIFLPFYTALKVVKSSPMFGTGISGKSVAVEVVKLPSVEPNHLLSNNVASLFVYFGIIGSGLLIYLLVKLLRRNRVGPNSVVFFSLFCLAISMGGFESPRFWGYTFLIFGIYSHRNMYGVSGNSR